MCLYDVSHWCSVNGKNGPRTDTWGTPVTSWCDVDTSPPQATLKMMRGWTEESDDSQCQRRQTDQTERELMICNQLSQSAGLQWLIMQSQLNGHFWNLMSSWLFCEINNDTRLKTTCYICLILNERRETGLSTSKVFKRVFWRQWEKFLWEEMMLCWWCVWVLVKLHEKLLGEGKVRGGWV